MSECRITCEAEMRPLAREVLGVLRAKKSQGVRLRDIALRLGRQNYLAEVSGALTVPLRLGLIVRVSRGVYAAAWVPRVESGVAA